MRGNEMKWNTVLNVNKINEKKKKTTKLISNAKMNIKRGEEREKHLSDYVYSFAFERSGWA